MENDAIVILRQQDPFSIRRSHIEAACAQADKIASRDTSFTSITRNIADMACDTDWDCMMDMSCMYPWFATALLFVVWRNAMRSHETEFLDDMCRRFAERTPAFEDPWHFSTHCPTMMNENTVLTTNLNEVIIKVSIEEARSD